jgi:hypothetical protein
MYYPKSQVKTNLYTTGGDFRLQNSTTPYKGYYYQTSDGKYFSGRTPNESPTFELIKISPSLPTTNLSEDLLVENLPVNDYYTIEDGYARSTNLSFNQEAPSPPKQTYPVLTDNDYKLGEFQRYFLKKGNEIKFLEISLEDYRKYVNQDKDVMFELYTPIQINWILTGEKEQVYRVNQSIVARTEREQNLPGFTQYFRNRFTQFYKYIEASNLYTAGNEFKTEKGVNYIGFYHIHDSKGPMVGKTHIEDPHEYLFPINETITSRTQNQTPNFIPQNNVATTQSIYTPSNISMGGGGGGGGGGGY